MTSSPIPRKYLPLSLTRRDRRKQRQQLLASRRAYRRGKYLSRTPLSSFHGRPSAHVAKAKRWYKVDTIGATPALARASHCSLATLRGILHKGRGAFYSSGSRPNQSAESWAIARLASALTRGKAAAVDAALLRRGCNHATSMVFSPTTRRQTSRKRKTKRHSRSTRRKS